MIRGKVKISEEHFAGLEPRALRRQRLLHLDDHLRVVKHLVRGAHDGGPGGRVLLVHSADAAPGAGLHDHLMAVRRELTDVGRHQPDAVLVNLDFPGYTDQHCVAPESESPAAAGSR